MSIPRGTEINIRMSRVTAYLLYGGELTTKVLREKYGYSKAQARRVMLDLERTFPEVVVEERPYPNTALPQRVLSMPPNKRAA